MKKLICFFTLILLILPLNIKAANKEKCIDPNYPSCCYYKNNSAGFFYAVRIDFSGKKPVLYDGNYANKAASIELSEYYTSEEYYVESLNSCPENVLLASKKGLFGESYKIMFGDYDTLKAISLYPQSYDFDSTAILSLVISEEENKKIISELQRHADIINERIQAAKDGNCFDPSIYEYAPGQEKWQQRLACIGHIQDSINNAVANGKNEIEKAKNAGITDESKYKALANLNRAINDAENIDKQITNFETVYQDNENNTINGNNPPGAINANPITPGTPIDCPTLKTTNTYKIIKQVYMWLQIAAPIMLIIFGVLDFGKAVAAGEADAMKKAQGAFVKRLIIVVVIILFPIIMDVLIGLLEGIINGDLTTCGIGR